MLLVKVCRRFRQQVLDACQQHVCAKLVLGRYRQNLCVGQKLVPLLYNVAQLLLVALVNLVDKQYDGDSHLCHLVKEVTVLLRILHNVGDIEENVCIL